jgi:hypothetical protein
MGTIKKNPNDLQIKQAKSTRPEDPEKEQLREYREIKKRKPKKVAGGEDESAADEQPFDAQSNNIHRKR